jgi:hypothetical protein
MANQQNLPSMPVHLIPPSWPLQRWGMDLVGPLPTAQGNCRFTAVAVDYFTKWVEAKPLVNIKVPKIQKFFWQNIICRFGVPKELTVHNGKCSTVTFSKNIASPWALMRNSHQCIICSLTEQLKGQMV